MTINPEYLIPSVVLDYDRDKPWADWIIGTVIFADVSGFTPMSEALSPMGAEGAEILTDILNRYFSEMIGIVHHYGGQVMKFGGDAILCFFPGENTLHQSIYAAQCMQNSLSKFQSIKTPARRFALKMKIGVAYGECLLAGVGESLIRCDYAFAGKTVDLTAEAEHNARAGEIVLAVPPEIEKYDFIITEPINNDFVSVKTVSPIDQFNRLKPKSRTNGNLEAYIITEILSMVNQGYDKYIGTLQGTVPCFLQFTGFTYSKDSFDVQQFHLFFSHIMEITNRYQGSLNRISMGDKGSTFFILFGSPQPLEKKEELACMWALDIMNSVKDKFPAIGIKIGMNGGRLFSGIVGGSNRFDYTVMGDVVNLAARLMQGSGQFEINTSQEIKLKAEHSFEFIEIGKRQFKGKRDSQTVFLLRDHKKAVEIVESERPLVGRDNERREVIEHLHDAQKNKPGMLVLEGTAGVGKSYLVNNILKFTRENNWSICLTRAEITQRSHIYSPWYEVCLQLFFDGEKPTLTDIQKLLQGENNHINYLSWFADFFKIECSEELSEFDGETRKKMFQHQLAQLILDYAKKRPTLISFDDLHWFDSLSIEFLSTLLNHLKDEPIFILCSTRSNWNNDAFTDKANCLIMRLNELSKEETVVMAEEILDGSIRGDLSELLYTQTKGNPFYIINFLNYLTDNNITEKRLGWWTIKHDAVIKETFSSDDLIIAQIDKLSMMEKIHLRYATCIGTTFSRKILKRAMGNNFKSVIWDGLAQSNYFYKKDAESFAFHHAMVQDTIYHSIPNKNRKQIHKKVGLAIENTHKSNLQEWYPNLANHFFLASVRKKAISYCIVAGEQLYQKSSFDEASQFFHNAFSLLKHTSDDRKWDVGLALGQNLLNTGKLLNGLEHIKYLKRAAQRKVKNDIYFRAALLQFNIQTKQGDYSFLPYANRLLKRDTEEKYTLGLMYVMGKAYYSKGRFNKAEHCLLKTVNNLKRLHDFETFVSAYMYLAAVPKKRGAFEKALKVIDQGISLADEYNYIYQSIRLRFEKANIYMEKGDREQAKSMFLELLPKYEEIGDLYLLGTLLLNLGRLYIETNQFDEAKMYLAEADNYLDKIGALNARAYANQALGAIAFFEQRLADAYDYYLSALRAYEKLGELGEITETYYNLAEVSIQLNRLEEARTWLKKFHNEVLKTNNPNYLEAYQQLKAQLNNT